MKTMSKKLSALCSIVLCTFLFNSCEAEKEFIENSTPDGIVIERFSLRNPKTRHNQKLNECVKQLKEMQLNPNIGARVIFNPVSGLFFDDEQGLFIQGEDKQSYTFPVLEVNPDAKVRNICFNQKNNGEIDVYLVKYDFTKEEYETLSDEALQERESNFVPLLKDGNVVNFLSYVCVDVIAFVSTSVAPLEQGELTGNFGYQNGGIWVTIASQCFFTEIGSSNGSGSNDGGVLSGPGSGGPGGTDQGIITGSIVSDAGANGGTAPIGTVIGLFTASLEPDQLDVFSAHPEFTNYLTIDNCSPTGMNTVIQFINYVIQNDNTQQSNDLVTGLINASLANNAEFEIKPENTVNNSMVFDDFPALQDYLGENSLEPGVEDYEEVTDQQGRFANFKFNIKYGGGILVKAKIVETPNSYTIQNVTSSFYGVSFFSEWEQNDFIVTYLPNDKIKIVVAGTVKTAGFLDGVGLGITENYVLTVIYDTSSGIVDSSNWEKI